MNGKLLCVMRREWTLIYASDSVGCSSCSVRLA